MLNIASTLQRNARIQPQQPAVLCGPHQLSYGELDAAASQLGHGLKARGIAAGDKVALSCPNLPYFPIAYYALLKIGATVVPLNVLLGGDEIAYHLEDSQAIAYLCFEGTDQLPMADNGYQGFNQVDSCEQFFVITADPTAASPIDGISTLAALMRDQPTTLDYFPTRTDDTAVILYTSGTTGQPKGAELTHNNLMMNSMACVEIEHLSHRDCQLIALPLFHSFGQIAQMSASVTAAATMVLLPRFDPQAAIQLMLDNKVTVFAGVPTMYIALLEALRAGRADQLARLKSHLRLGISGGASLPVEILNAFNEQLDIKLLEGYGLSETSPVASFNRLDGDRLPGSVGQSIAGVEIKIVDSDDNALPPGERGEVVIRGHNIMKGYFHRPDATASAIRNGWFHTGDIGTLDDRGNLFIVDRLKDMIIRGGYNVYPREIEEVLISHPAVQMVAVVADPDPRLGEEVHACVVLHPDQAANANDLQTWCKERLASYKYPRLISFHRQLPMTATGKILKRKIKHYADYQQPE